MRKVTREWCEDIVNELEVSRQEDGPREPDNVELFAIAHLELLDQVHNVRRILWLNHGHDGLYGDDGEMQCNLGGCLLDFKRAPLADIAAAALRQARKDTERWDRLENKVARREVADMLREDPFASLRDHVDRTLRILDHEGEKA